MYAHVSATAAPVALVRAAEASLPAGDRLFEDPFASLFVDAGLDTAVVDRFLQVPFMRESIRLRTRRLDDVVRAAVADGIAQVVLLGAGFDCRGLRMPELARPGVRVFEVDFAEQLAHKRDVLARAGVALPSDIRHVACDFTADDFGSTLPAALEAAGLERDAGALVVWEGVVGYLDDVAIDRTLAMIARPIARPCRLAFNYTTGRFTPESMAQRLRAAGFEVDGDVDLDTLHRRLLRGEPPAGGERFRVCTAVVA
jgi:methyltransferase (TIGR00027 family)